jgi:flavin reductase (DIM6/NTAB) family NADH-FMN oxidoreductase RutF
MSDSDPQRQLAAALGRVPSGLFVVTVPHDQAETGMLASWIQQCSFEPPQISVAIKCGRDIAAWLMEDAPFVVNVLDESQTDMLIHFGRGFKLDEPAFTGLAIERSESGAPVLSEALAYLDCQVVACYPGGDHDLYIGRVVAGRMLSEGHPMVHIRKSGLHY